MTALISIDYKTLFESSPDYYLIVKPNPPDFTIVTMTDSLLKIAQKPREEIIGRGLFEVFPINPDKPGADGRRNLNISLNRVVDKRIPDSMAVQKYDIQIMTPNGPEYEEHYWSTISIPIFRNDEMIYILHRTEDVTQLICPQGQTPGKELMEHLQSEIIARAKQIQEANEKLHDAVQLREDVIAIVSHDLKNPLGSIELSSELLKQQPHCSDSEIAHIIEIIDRSVNHMKRLIGDLLSFAKIQSGNLTIEPSQVSLNDLINDGIQSVQNQALKKKITIEKQIHCQVTHVYCDHDRMLEVISNILGNAIKFSPKQSSILFTLQELDSELQFSIKDNGPGILPEHLLHLFDRYWQAKETAKHGTGLGLAIARGVILGHHGKIWAESTPQQGTTMSFSIPKVDPSRDLLLN